MPLFDFRCRKCGRIFEDFRNFQEMERKIFPYCCNNKARPIISRINGIVFQPQYVEFGDRNTKTYVRNKQQLIDAQNRYNDSKEAQMHGKIYPWEKLSKREV